MKTKDDGSASTHGPLKASLSAALMIPVAVAILAGAYTCTSDLGAGLPLLAAGVVLVVFNAILLKVLFSRLDPGDQKPQDKDTVEGP